MAGFGIASYGFSPYGFGATSYILGTAKLIIPHNLDYGTQKISISFDARLTDTNDYALLHKMVSGKEEWGFLQNSGTLYAVMYEGGSSSSVSATPQTNLFQTFIGVYDGVNWSFYIDNVFTASTPIGTRDISDGQIEVCLDGTIRNIRIWDTDLSTSEIKDVTYNRDIPTTGLVGEWLLTDNATGVVTDSAGSNNGSIVSGTWTGGTHNSAASNEDWTTYSVDCLNGSNIDWPVITNGTSSTSSWDVDSNNRQFLQTIGYLYRSDPYDILTLKVWFKTDIDVEINVHFDLGVPAGTGWDRNASTTVISLSAGDKGWREEDFLIPNVSGEHQLINVWLSVERSLGIDEGLFTLHQVRVDWKIS